MPEPTKIFTPSPGSAIILASPLPIMGAKMSLGVIQEIGTGFPCDVNIAVERVENRPGGNR